MTHWRTTIEKDYLGAWDLVGKDDKPRDFTLKITTVKSDVVKTRDTPKGKRKCVIGFKKASKKFIANTTNCETIESLYGPQIEDWIGKLITLHQGDVRNPKGSPPTIKGIKVRPRIPTGKEDEEEIGTRPVDEAMRAEQDAAFDRGDNPDDH